MASSLSGTRIRQLRRKRGMKQGALAKKAEISASYLNLIEHNRRPVAGRVLASLAQALNTSVSNLRDGADGSVVEDLVASASEYAAHGPETDRVHELFARFPGWARILAAQSRELRDASATINAMNDRYNFDPKLQSSLHEMLTTITAIRSASSILTSEDDIEPSQSTAFQSNIHSEAVRLSDAVSKLVDHFDSANEHPASASSPHEAFEQFLERNGYAFDILDAVPDEVRAIEQIIERGQTLDSAEAKTRARAWLAQYAADARTLPLDAFAAAAKTCGYAPHVLAETFNTDLHTVFRRLSTLERNNIDAPSFGLVIVNAAGQPVFRRPLREFSLPRFSSICALWPVFLALSSPGTPLEETIALPDGREFLARAIALPLSELSFGAQASFGSAMLVTPLSHAHRFGMVKLAPNQSTLHVGTSCRLCDRDACAVRSEPHIL